MFYECFRWPYMKRHTYQVLALTLPQRLNIVYVLSSNSTDVIMSTVFPVKLVELGIFDKNQC